MKRFPTLLIVDDEKATRDGLRAALEDSYDVYVAEDAESAVSLMESQQVDLLLTDFRLPNESGIDLIKRAKRMGRPPACILMTAYGSEDIAVEAIREGADDYISKGRMQIELVENRLQSILRKARLEEENTQLHQRLDETYGFDNLVGRSAALREAMELVRQVAPARASVLIQGETGVGKEMVAKAIHQLSPRSRRPMVTVHCEALTSTLLESELFGHEKGAFTGAVERRTGRFEQADGGTLFLDEIGEIDASVQVKLLRFLGERTIERVGSNTPIPVDARILAATNRDLEQMVREGEFREDLYFRLKVVEIHMPSLRERLEDIPLLANRFLEEFSDENAKTVSAISSEAMDVLLKHRWPGNVRELRFAMESAVVLCRSETILPRDLPASVRGEESRSAVKASPDAGATAPEGLTVKESEKQLIIRALQECGGNRTAAAKRIGVSRRTLHRKLHAYQLEHL